MPMDCRGVRRGRCLCLHCDCGEYDGGSVGKRCLCRHTPGEHENMDVITTNSTTATTEELLSPIPLFLESIACSTEIVGISGLDQEQKGKKSGGKEQETSNGLLSGNLECELSIACPVSFEQCSYPDCRRPRFEKHQCCGKTHSRMYRETNENLKASPEELCNTPGCNKRKFDRDNGTMFDYCSKSCRDYKQKKGQTMLLQEDLGRCHFPDCTKVRYQDPSNGRVHHFCTRTHAEQAKLKGIPDPESNSSISLVDLAAKNGTEVSKQFKQMWDPRKGKCPAISFIFSITNAFLKQTWYAYQKTLQDPSMESYFHGTLLKCNITAQRSLCTNDDCGICGIVTTGFDRRCIRKNINFQRFGHGFYVAPNSSKCHDYTQGKHGFRAMILLEVCPGKKYVRRTDDETLKEPPSGFNSVHGESGETLNYDELVLYNPDCAFPKYIIVYQHDGEHKIAK